MTRKTREPQNSSSDDDAPEIVSKSISQADAKRNQKVLHDFEVEERARRKARNRERDQKLKQRALVNKGGASGKTKGVRFVDLELEEEDEGKSEGDDEGRDDDVETRMLRAMREAAGEMESSEESDDEDGQEIKGFGQEVNPSDDAEPGSDDNDTEMSSVDPEIQTDDEGMDEEEEVEEGTLPRAKIHKSSRRVDYLADDLFATAFASQSSRPPPKKTKLVGEQTVKKQRRKSKTTGHPKDLVIGGRTIRTLPQLSDPRSQATARSVPSAGARKFVEHSLAMKGNKRAVLKAKKKGWERRPANVGVLKYQGAPHGFARSTR